MLLKNLSKLEEITENSHLAVKLDRIQLTVGLKPESKGIGFLSLSLLTYGIWDMLSKMNGIVEYSFGIVKNKITI